MKILARRTRKGFAITEAAAALALLLPLIFLVIYGVMEASYAYMLKNSLSEAARHAARDLAVYYGQDPAITSDRSLQNTVVFDKIRITNVVNSSNQFDDPTFNTGPDPPTVTVTVRYLGGRYGLSPFPNPDPLNLGSNFQIMATSTYRLE